MPKPNQSLPLEADMKVGGNMGEKKPFILHNLLACQLYQWFKKFTF